MFKLVVLFSVLALAAAKPNWVAPLAYTVPAVSSVSQYSSGVYHGSPVVPSLYGAYSPYPYSVVPAFSGFSQAPNSPAVVLDAVNGVPLDTPEVVAARAAHYQSKALASVGVHSIAKRSLVAPFPYTSVVSPVSPVSPLVRSVVSPYYTTPYVSGYTPYAYPAVVPKAYSVHPW